MDVNKGKGGKRNGRGRRQEELQFPVVSIDIYIDTIQMKKVVQHTREFVYLLAKNIPTDMHACMERSV
jgi:hypothetical protein